MSLVKNNKLVIVINKSVNEIFSFLINPKNTPLWVDSIVSEEVNEKPTRIGTVYKNVNQNGIWTEYVITAFTQDKMFIFTTIDKNYHVKYTFTSLGENSTRLEYYEWVEKGEIQDPFSIDILKKLKAILER